MKIAFYYFLWGSFFYFTSAAIAQNVGINETGGVPNESALLDIDAYPSNDKGFLIPRLTTSQRDNISNPAHSLLIFNISTQCFEGYSEPKDKWFAISCFTEEFACGEEFIDVRDKNSYKTVQIGSQCWMAENLKYLPEVVGSGSNSITVPFYYVYDYNGMDTVAAKVLVRGGVPIYATYGVLYNWSAVMQGVASSTANPSGVQGVCPEGWHVPSDVEWCEMENYIEPKLDTNCNKTSYRGSYLGTKLRAVPATPSFMGWNGVVVDNSGFSALPGGERVTNGIFGNRSALATWWTTTESGDKAFYRGVYSTNPGVNRNLNNKGYGLALRCVLD